MKTIDIANGQYVCEVLSARGMDGKRIKIGDNVLCYSIYDKTPQNIVKVIGIRKQGNGVVLICDKACTSISLYHFSHMARSASKVS